ncbi:MAG: CDP-alcohol phosphatidyltransferase family protein [Polyangiaceae bacterium]|nr:CDP-alcohol phosphatidyltransferase family protein [Polyangiaceae bacterium]
MSARPDTDALALVPSAHERRGGKPCDVEEPVDQYLHRPLAALLARRLEPRAVTPNQVTVASGVVGLGAGAAMALGHVAGPPALACGAVLLFASVVLDCADGQLARLRGSASLLGRVLDGAVDVVTPLAVFHGLAVYLLGRGTSFALAWSLGWAAGASLLWHTTQYDVAKNAYLHHTRPDFDQGGPALVGGAEVATLRRELAASGARGATALVGLFALWLELGRRGGPRAPERQPPTLACDAERAAYRRRFAGHMRATRWLGLGTHLALLTASAVAGAVDARAILVGWLVMVGPMNLACAALVWRRAVLERRFLRDLARLRADLSVGAARG